MMILDKQTLLSPLLLLALMGCSSSVEASLPTAWSADLAPTRTGSLGPVGSVNAVSEGIHTEVAIALSRAEPDLNYEWRILSGNCGEQENTIGGLASYPTLKASGNGSATADALLNETLDQDGTYHAVVIDAATMQTVACGSLERVD